MKRYTLYLLRIYFAFVLIFMIQKPLFMLYHLSLYKSVSWTEWFKVIWHGLPLDFSMSACFLAIPILLCIFSTWIKGSWHKTTTNIYLFIMLFLSTTAFVCDLELYKYWGFRLDTTPLMYLKSPKDAVASVSAGAVIAIIAAIIAFSIGAYLLFRSFLKKDFLRPNHFLGKAGITVLLLFYMVFLIIPIRGGISVSTMNVGKAYYSTNMYLNHAAINPMFSFISSLFKNEDYSKQYRYMDDNDAHKIFQSELSETKSYSTDIADSLTSPKLLKTTRPNVILIVLESFSGIITEDLGGIKDIAPNLNKLTREGIFFSNMYANGDRTDKGLVSILSGYPTQPNTSIMKYPRKSQSLPSISKTLKSIGYHTSFLYGGDADFSNMRSYFIGANIEKIISIEEFGAASHLSKWGALDEKTFARFREEIEKETEKPFFKMFLTLSSHEPFDVPMKRFDDPYLNSVAYTDSCIGEFIGHLKQDPQWDNSLIILVPDHCMRYPYSIENHKPLRYHIPMIWTGGAITGKRTISEFGSQIDLAATLFNQMELPHDEFIFSKDIMNKSNPKFGFYSFNNGFGMMMSNGHIVYNCAAEKVTEIADSTNNDLEKKGKAFLQVLYDDLGSR